ncbi:MAG: hypothetical protein ACO3NK_13230 [Prochlorotrichaceae cyanobacterium]|jgi:hypothetical protein
MSHYPDSHSNTEAGEISQVRKPLGRYLVEAGLLSQAQLDIALRDQEYSGYPLGEILVLRGWVQQSVIDLVVQKLQPVSDASQSELRIVIEHGHTLARGILGQGSSTTILADDDTQLELWDQETTTIHNIAEYQDMNRDTQDS